MTEISRAGSFGRVVGDYERGRPRYPEDTVRWLVEGCRRAVDLGAGTGKFTGSIVELVDEVVALEPQEAMVRQLADVVPDAVAVCAGAEALPVRSGWADAVVVAQAFHWFDQARALPEIARVLGVGGRLGLVWNVRDESVEWVAELARIAGPDNSAEVRAALREGDHFGPFEARRWPMVQVLDGDSLVAHVRSRSNVASLADAERAAVLAAVDRLRASHPDLAGKERIEFPYVTEAYRAARKERA